MTLATMKTTRLSRACCFSKQRHICSPSEDLQSICNSMYLSVTCDSAIPSNLSGCRHRRRPTGPIRRADKLPQRTREKLAAGVAVRRPVRAAVRDGTFLCTRAGPRRGAPRRKMKPQSTRCYRNHDFPGLKRALKHTSEVPTSVRIRHDAPVQCAVISCALFDSDSDSAHLENGALNSATKIARLPPQPFQEVIRVGCTAKNFLDEHLCSTSDSVLSH